MDDEHGRSAVRAGLGGVGGSMIGYGRESVHPSTGPVRDQQAVLLGYGCTRVHLDVSPTASDRGRQPELIACLATLSAGDVLVVVRLDRLARSLPDLVSVVNDLRFRGVGLHALEERLNTATAGGEVVAGVFAALGGFLPARPAEGDRDRDGTNAGRVRRGRTGRPSALTPEKIERAAELLTWPEHSISSIARELDVSRSTLYKHMSRISDSTVDALPSSYSRR